MHRMMIGGRKRPALLAVLLVIACFGVQGASDRGSAVPLDGQNLAAGANSASRSLPAGLKVYTGYADVRDGTMFPSPWAGDANVTVIGNAPLATAPDPDEAAVRIDNTSAIPITVSNVTVTCGTTVFDPWGSNTVPPGMTYIFTGTLSTSTDTSDICPLELVTVAVTVGSTTDTFVDSANAFSPATSSDESQPWSLVGVGVPPTTTTTVPVTTTTTVVSKARPALATQASPGNLAGAPVRDTATVSGGSRPSGTVTFRLFSDAACMTQVFGSTITLAGVTATSDWYTPSAVGTYRWTALYSGDTNNNTATSGCNAPNESVVIAPFQPPTCTQTISGDLVGPVTVGAGQAGCITNARVVGPVTVNPGGALTVVNSQINRGITADNPSFLSICGASVSGPSPNQALGVSNATVPIRIGDPANGCAGNRFAGDVNLTSNLAVTFGANIVSNNVNINNNGPGNTVIKANNVYGALSCTGNNPPPTNAGQANTAASRSGQCSSL